MDIEVVGKIYYTVSLTDDDLDKVKKYIQDNKEELSFYSDRTKILFAIRSLYADGSIDLFENEKYSESDFSVEEIEWSNFEFKSPKEILGE